MTTPTPLHPTLATHPTATEYVRAYRDWCFDSDADAAGMGSYEMKGLCAYLDEQATVHPIAGGQLSPNYEAPRYGRAFPGRLAPTGDVPLRVSCPPADTFAEPLTTMPRDYDHGLAEPQPSLAVQLSQAKLDLIEAQAELTRIKADNERLKERLRLRAEQVDQMCRDDLEESAARAAKLTDAEQTIAGLRDELAWEKGWDLCRKAQTGAVVEAARAVASRDWHQTLVGNISDLREALSALDALSQPEVARCECPDDPPGAQRIAPGCPRHDKRSEPEAARGRPIVVGSMWRHKRSGSGRKVSEVGPRMIWMDTGSSWHVDEFRAANEWVSDPDPAPAGETPEGETP